jgi:hypothetical protein
MVSFSFGGKYFSTCVILYEKPRRGCPMIRNITSLLRRIVGRIKKMIKNLTFWSVILGFLMGYVMSAGDELIGIASANISAIRADNAVFWKFLIWLIVFVPFAIIFFFAERRQSGKTTEEALKTNKILEAIAKRLGVNEDEYGSNESKAKQ